MQPAPATRYAAISPVWEVPRSGHSEIGVRAAVLQRDANLQRGLAAGDLAAAFVALLAMTSLFGGGQISPRLTVVLIVPLVLIAGKLIGLYDRDQHLLRKVTIDEMPSLIYLSVIYALAVWLGEAVFIRGWLSRPQVFGLLLCTFVLLAGFRIIVRRIHFVLSASERCVVIGNEVDAARIAAKFELTPAVNAAVIGRIPLREVEESLRVSDPPAKLGDYDQLAKIVEDYGVERVILAPDSEGQDQILDAIRALKALGVKVSVLPRLLEVVGSSSTFDEVDGISLLGVRPYGLARSSQLVKRAMDITVAGLGLLTLGPLFLMLTLAIKLDDGGPIFFGQRRIGRRGEDFCMLKFRSMVNGADAMKDEMRDLNGVDGGLFKIADDPRVTRVGKLLRSTSLDELPQLFNVLRGDMSLVGPRPLVPDEDALISGWQRRRLSVRPGMTGMWQIFGSSKIPMHEMVKIDYAYGANWSLWLDVRILLRTIPYMLSRRGV